MTEIPEHLLKRAQAAREKAAAESGDAGAAAAGGGEAASDPRIPAHLLERSKAARGKSEGDASGAVAVQEKVASVVAAAPAGGGVPVGALLAKEHCSVFEPGDHGNTFGGNPLATAAGTYVMRQLLDGGVLENVHARSEQLRQRLEGIVDRHDMARGVRGKGLLLGLELNKEVAGDVVVAGVGDRKSTRLNSSHRT